MGILRNGRCRALARYVAMACMVAVLAPSARADGGIAVIKSQDLDPYNQALAGFIGRCADDIVQFNLGGSHANRAQIAADVARRQPRLVLAVGLLAAQLAKERLSQFPVLFVMVSNPRKYGLVGNNIAGISLDIPVEAQFKTYRSLVPSLKTIGTIYDPRRTASVIQEANAVAKRLGLSLLAVPVSSQKEVPAALRSLLGKVESLWMVPDETVVTADSFKHFLITTFENRLPFLAASDIFVEAGALASLTPDYSDVGRQSCELAKAFAAGRLDLADVNVSAPQKVNLSVNLKTANKIGLSVPQDVLRAATSVYQ